MIFQKQSNEKEVQYSIVDSQTEVYNLLEENTTRVDSHGDSNSSDKNTI